MVYFEVEGGDERTNEITDRTHTRIVSFIVLDVTHFFSKVAISSLCIIYFILYNCILSIITIMCVGPFTEFPAPMYKGTLSM